MLFAIDEINRSDSLLPNVTLGYRLHDNCASLGVAFRAAFSLASGKEVMFDQATSCRGTPVVGIVGDSMSTNTIAISSVLGLFKMPMVSYFATCSCLSDRQRFPSFFRTIPSDAFQVRAMLQILKRFGWTWIGLLVSDDDYGLNVARSFQSELAQSGEGCLAYLEVLPWGNNPGELQRIVGKMKKSTSCVVIVFAHENHMLNLLGEVVRQNVTGLQWMASEAWTATTVLQIPSYMPFLAGTLGIAIRRGEIPGLRDFLLRIRPDNDTLSSKDNNIVQQFWEETFQCRFPPSPPKWTDEGGRLCTGQENLATVKTEFLDVSNLRPEYNVYKAVYAMAHALHDMLKCVPGSGPFVGQTCASLQRLEPWQLVYYLDRINFTTPFGDQVSFDENGDALPIYDVMNWLWLPDGSTFVQNVGVVKETAAKGGETTLKEDIIFWNFVPKKPPRSVCSESCPPGTRMARRKNQPDCCFDCIPCSEGEISNRTDSTECLSCPEDFWSSPQRDVCVPKMIEFLSYNDPLGISLTTASLIGTLNCAIVLGIFTHHRTTPVLQEPFSLNGMYKQGDIVLGGLFETHYTSIFPKSFFTSKPQQPICQGFDIQGFRHSQTMLFAVDEINRSDSLLPNVTLGYRLHDNCASLGVAFRAAFSLASGKEEKFDQNASCRGTPVVGIVGDSSSTNTIAISSVFGLFKMPMVRAMLQILKRFGWTWFGLLISDDDYGLNAARSFQSELAQSGGGCLDYLEVLPWGKDPGELQRIVDTMKKSTSRVVIVFAHENHMFNLMGEVQQFWEETFQCRFPPSPPKWTDEGGRLCTGQENLATAETEFLDVSNLRPEYNVYKAVYAMAHALHDMLRFDRVPELSRRLLVKPSA
ncbi:unnamed protein product [Boreogadus saida]